MDASSRREMELDAMLWPEPLGEIAIPMRRSSARASRCRRHRRARAGDAGGAGFPLVHVSGLAVNRARQGTVGGEHKTDPRDARVIADQVRIRRDLRPIEPGTELDLELRLLVGRRRDLVDAQTQRLGRMHDLLVGIFPGLERVLDLTTKGALHLVSRYVTPAELRAAGAKRLLRHLKAAGGVPHVEALADKALAAAREQDIAVPGERMTARLVRELAVEALATRARLAALDREIEALLARHPDAALIRSLPGMGAVLTAELIAEAGSFARFRSADALAAAAGSRPCCASPARSASSGAHSAATRPSSGSSTSPPSARSPTRTAAPSTTASAARAKRHHQALLALARRRINVLWAMLNTRQAFQPGFKMAA